MLRQHSSNTPTRDWLFDLIILVFLLGLFYAIWIGSHALVTPDEGRYSEVAREMVVTGDYITPRLNGVAFLDKPVLYYWLQASAIKLFGLSEAALRFWPVLMGVMGCIVTYLAGRVLFNRRTGIVSAIILATSPLYYGAAHYANLDLEVGVLISNALFSFIIAMVIEHKSFKTGFLLLAYVFAGLAGLTKGLIGIAFPMMIIGAWILILNRWSLLLKMRLVQGLLIFFAITVPWYVLVQKANPEFLHFFFVTQQVARFLTMQDFNSKAAYWFYVPVVLAGMFPWSLFLFQGLWKSIKAVWQNRQANAIHLYLVLWFVIVFGFFSFPKSKTVGYILPILPVSALLIGQYLCSIWESVATIRFAARLIAGFCLLLSLVFVAMPAVSWIDIPSNFLPYLHAMAITFLVGGITSYIMTRSDSLWPVLASATITIMTVIFLFIASTPYINEKSVKPIAMTLKPKLQPTDEVVTLYKYYQDLPVYLERRITIVADWHAADIPKKDNWVREMWYGMVFQDTKDWLIEDAAFWRRWNSPKRVYVITDEDNFRKLSRKTRVYKIQQANNIVLMTNQSVG